MKGRAFIAGALSGSAVLVLCGWAPGGLAEANGCVTASLDPAPISAVVTPSARPSGRVMAAPSGMQTSAVKEPDERLDSSSPVPFVAPGVDGLGASDVYFNKQWIGVDLASHRGRDATFTRGGS